MASGNGQTDTTSCHGTGRPVPSAQGLTALLSPLSGGDAHAGTATARASDRQPLRIPVPTMRNLYRVQDGAGTARGVPAISLAASFRLSGFRVPDVSECRFTIRVSRNSQLETPNTGEALKNLIQRNAFFDQHDGNVFTNRVENLSVGSD